MAKDMFLGFGSQWSGMTAFSDPRKGVDRRTRWSRTGSPKNERRGRIVDRRVYTQQDAVTPWWLLRTYVSSEKFIDHTDAL
jgi:hypothetical protein